MELKKMSIALMMLIISGVTFGQSEDIKYSCQTGDVAFDGYDLVSYFKDDPKKGKEQYSTT